VKETSICQLQWDKKLLVQNAAGTLIAASFRLSVFLSVLFFHLTQRDKKPPV
jgi:hypothetical protein